MESDLKSLSQIFQQSIFRIPDYQRGYAWQKPQLEDFWNDLINLQSNKYHYTGMLSLKELASKEVQRWDGERWLIEGSDYKAYHIVDGQQRITTCVILLHEIVSLLRRLNPSSKDNQIEVNNVSTVAEVVKKYLCVSDKRNGLETYLFGYEKDNPSSQYMVYRIFEAPHSPTLNESYYTKNLLFAKNFFRNNLNKLYELDGLSGIQEVFQKLTQKLKYNIHNIGDDYDVFVAFETMNNRGKKLTNLELLKNRLIYLSTIYDAHTLSEDGKAKLREDINKSWQEIYYQLGRNDMIPLSDDEYLRAHWTVYYRYTRRRGDDYIRFLLEKFAAKNIYEKSVLVAPESVAEYNEDMSGIADEEDIADDGEVGGNAKLMPQEIRDYVNSIMEFAKFWYATFFPYQEPSLTDDVRLRIDRLNRLGIGYFRPLVAVAIKVCQEESELVGLLDRIEQFIFMLFRMGFSQASYKSSEHYRYANDLYFGHTTVLAITDSLRTTIDNDRGYCIKTFKSRMDKMFTEQEGYYSWHTLRYFMYEYEYSLIGDTGIKKIDWTSFTSCPKDHVTIEHILPQTPTDDYWVSRFGKYAEGDIRIFTGSIGNLLPLSQSVNSSLQNISFDLKVSPKDNRRRGYKDGSHSEIEVAKYAEWTLAEIYVRSKHLLEFMSSRWGLDLSSDDIKELTHLGQYIEA